MELNKMKRSGWEYFVIFGVVGCTLLLTIAIYAKQDQVYKEKLLIWELLTLRNYVTAYTLEHRRHPEDLGLWTKDYGLEINPFGNPYHYDFKTGWVG